MQSIVILGSGLAGYSVAREVRKRSKSDRVTVISSDDGHFYSKPGLSEAFRQGTPPAELVSRTADEMAAQIKGDVLPFTTVTAVDTASRTLATSRGDVRYDKLVLALGAQPTRLPLDDASLSRLFQVNDLCDYRRFREAAEGRRVVAILGAGLIGCEFANDLIHAGYRIEIVDIAHAPLSRLLPEVNGRFMRDALEAAGVRWHLGTAVQAIAARPGGVTVRCTNGEAFDADLVLSAIGLRPRTQLARDAGLAVDHGIVVDTSLRTSDPHVYALGDCAQVHHLWLPYISPIVPAARVIATNLAGDHAAVRYAAMPVVVKTSACPTVSCPPPAGLHGVWDTESDASGVQSLFHDADGLLRGFALNGSRTERTTALAQTVPMLIP